MSVMNPPLIIVLGIHALLHFADVVTTLKGLKQPGITEQNGIMAWAYRRYGLAGMIALKVLMFAVTVGLLIALEPYPIAYAIGAWGSIGILALIVLNNTLIITRKG